jgi:hypothetical protein
MDEKKPLWGEGRAQVLDTIDDRDRIQRVRATIAPRPEVHYPAPWRVTEGRPVDGGVLVEDASGTVTCTADTREAAEAIVLAVNTLAGVES